MTERLSVDEWHQVAIAATERDCDCAHNLAPLMTAVEAIVTAHVEARLAAVRALADEWQAWAKHRSTPRVDAFRDAAGQVLAAIGEDA